MNFFKNNQFWQIILLITITVISYINIFRNDFAYDDKDFLIDWPVIKDFQHIPELVLGELPPLHQGIYRPIRSINYLISYKLWGPNPFGYHLQALTIHISSVILVYLIVLQITKKKILSFGSALIFSVHPIHTEAVSYITASFDTLGITLFLLAFLLYIKANTYRSGTTHLYLISLFLITIAYFIYEMTLTFLLVIILYDICFRFLTKKNLFDKLKIYYLFSLPVSVYIIARFLIIHIGNRADYLGSIASVGAHQARIEFPFILAKYLSLIFIPHPLTITHVVPGNLVDIFVNILNSLNSSGKLLQLFAKIDFLLPFLEIVLLCLISARVFAREKLLKFTILWFFITLLPVSSMLPQGAIIAERFLYLPSVGLLIFLVCLLHKIYKRINNRIIKMAIISSFILVNLIFGYLTFVRNYAWRDSVALWKSAIKAAPNNFLPYGALGSSYSEIGEYQLAITYYKKSLALEPDNERVHLQLAKVYEAQGITEFALNEFQTALNINPRNPLTHGNLGELYNKMGQIEAAINEYKIAIKIFPSAPNFYYNLALIYDKQGNLELAQEYYKQTLQRDPIHTYAINNLAIIYSKQGNYYLAINLFEKVKQLEPSNPNPYFNLGKIYEDQSNFNKAIIEYQLGLKINPNQQEVKNKLDNLLNHQ